MRPPGPEPVSSFSSIPASPAKRRASGEAGMREPGANEAEMGADAGARTGFFPFATGGDAFAGEALAAAVLAPGAAPLVVSRPSAAPMGSCVPSGARMDSKVPSAGASTSIAALSVSSSTSGSPMRTRWPASFSQRSTVADFIVALSLGTRKSIGEPLLSSLGPTDEPGSSPISSWPGRTPGCPVAAGKPRSLCRHGRRRPTIHEFASRELGVSCLFVDQPPASRL